MTCWGQVPNQVMQSLCAISIIGVKVRAGGSCRDRLGADAIVSEGGKGCVAAPLDGSGSLFYLWLKPGGHQGLCQAASVDSTLVAELPSASSVRDSVKHHCLDRIHRTGSSRSRGHVEVEASTPCQTHPLAAHPPMEVEIRCLICHGTRFLPFGRERPTSLLTPENWSSLQDYGRRNTSICWLLGLPCFVRAAPFRGS